MDGLLITNGLMIFFSAVIGVFLLWQALRLRRVAPIRMQQRMNRDVTMRAEAMAAMAAAYPNASPAQRERLASNYRHNRAAVRALDPNFDFAATDAAFETANAARHAA